MAGNSLPVCKYGSSCYRKNLQHLRQYSHPKVVESKIDEKDNQKKDDTSLKPSQSRKRTRSFEEESSDDKEDISTSKRPDNIQCSTDKESLLIEKEEESDDVRENIKRKFLVQMPDDFYQFWDFCKSISPDNPLNALSSTLELTLVGPYHVLEGQLVNKGWTQCVLHYRYYYDPPELITVLAREEEEEGFHIGYYRDEPSNIIDSFMVSNTSSEGCVLAHNGTNIFAAVRNEVLKKLKKKTITKALKEDLKSLESSLIQKGQELGLNMKDIKPSKRKIVTKCFNGIGMSVPVNTTLDIGYRPLHMSNRELKQLLDKMVSCTDDTTKHDQLSESLHEMVTCVQFANDESDYGMGLELGTDLFCHGSEQFHDYVSSILPLAYQLLGRDVYCTIIQEHLKNRQKIPLDLIKNS